MQQWKKEEYNCTVADIITIKIKFASIGSEAVNNLETSIAHGPHLGIWLGGSSEVSLAQWVQMTGGIFLSQKKRTTIYSHSKWALTCSGLFLSKWGSVPIYGHSKWALTCFGIFLSQKGRATLYSYSKWALTCFRIFLSKKGRVTIWGHSKWAFPSFPLASSSQDNIYFKYQSWPGLVTCFSVSPIANTTSHSHLQLSQNHLLHHSQSTSFSLLPQRSPHNSPSTSPIYIWPISFWRFLTPLQLPSLSPWMFIYYQTTYSSLFRAPIRTQCDPGYKSINNSTIKSPFLMEPISLERPLTSLSDGISLISNESKLREKRPLLHGIQLFPQTSHVVFWI